MDQAKQIVDDRFQSDIPIRILGVETSCDETAAAVVENGRIILSNIVASQADLHAQFGGVFPEVASRQHIKTIFPVVQQALKNAHVSLSDLDAIAVTRGPGLPGSLVVGMNVAKGMSMGSGLPILGVNHLEGHLYSAWLAHNGIGESIDQENEELPPEPQFPLIALIVSGGHTELILMHGHLTYERLGGTLDDAAGEAFDKVARLLGFPYPGGPSIQKASKEGNPKAFDFPRAWLNKKWDFSFSGLKTAVLRVVRKLEEVSRNLPVEDLAASFQEAVIDVLVGKTIKAANEYQVKGIIIAGGVSANEALRLKFEQDSPFPLYIPPIQMCTDNAAMIAGLGYYRFVAGQRDAYDIDVLPNWPLSEVSSL